ncbi:MAG: OprO/OprP family phosphate-selective porin, partial [Planctomycetota bacterium]|nr:OprO/OprP family phosphate-selective porin [Planctomycetota bacterium]
MRNGSCFWRAAAIGALLIGLSHARATAQDYYYPPVPPSNDGQGEVTSTSYNAMMVELERRLAALEDKEKRDKKEDACKEVDIQTKPNHKLRGRLYADQLWMGDLQGPGGAVDTQDNLTGFDTARLGVTGNIYENLKYTAEFEFEGDEADYKDVYAQQGQLPWVGHLKVGYYKEYAGLEQMTSSRFITFMERSAPTAAFTPSRNWGVTFWNYTNESENFSWYAGLFRGGYRDNRTHRGTGSTGDGVSGDANDWAATARGAWLPYYDEATPGRCLLHVAGWVSFRRSPDGTENVGGNGTLEGFLELDSRDGPLDTSLLPDTENN